MNNEKILNALFKTKNPALLALKESAQSAVHQEVLQNINNPLECLARILHEI